MTETSEAPRPDSRGAPASPQRPALRITPATITGTVLVLIIAAICVRLGFWQLSRLETRRTNNTAMATRIQTPPAQLDAAPSDTTGMLYRRVLVHGSYDHGRSFVLAGRSWQGVPGVYLFTPLLLPNGGRPILVNRGFVHSPDAATLDLAPLSKVDTTSFTGILLPFPPAERERAARPKQTSIVRRFNESVTARLPYPIAPLYIQAVAPEAQTSRRVQQPKADTPILLPAPELDNGPHLSYAVQWFSFAVIFIVGWILLVIRRGT